MHLLHIRLLGEFEAIDHRGDSLSIGNKRTQALIVYLALRMQQGESIAEIAQLLFSGPDAEALAREAVSDLHYSLRYLAPELLTDEATGPRFNADLVDVDAQEFMRACESPSVAGMTAAAELYRGNLLERFRTGIAAFDEWLTDIRLTYWRTAVGVLGRLLAAQIKAGWWERAVETAGQLLSLDPTQEVVHRTLMRLQLEQGRADAALRRYQECADILQREFGREPTPETQHVRDEIIDALAKTPAIREMRRQPNGAPLLVLVVEDDIVSAALVEEFLTEAGYAVVAVNDGADALMEIAKRTFDLLILDINIPTLNGLRLFEVMIQKGIETPAIFMTGIPGSEVESRSLELGAADFLRKPIRKETLLPRVNAIVHRRQRANRSSQE